MLKADSSFLFKKLHSVLTMKPKSSKEDEPDNFLDDQDTSKPPQDVQSLELGQENMLIGKIEPSDQILVSRHYLLPLNSQAIRGIFSHKDRFHHIAQELKGELEFTRMIATLKNKDWPKYTLIEIRSVDGESLDRFEKRLQEINPAFSEKVTYDPYKYVCVQVISRPASLFVNPGESSSMSDDSDGEKDPGQKTSSSPKDTGKKKKMTKKAGERERSKKT